MSNSIQIVESVNSAVQSFVGGPIMLVLLVSTGVYFTFHTGFFQISKIGLWFSQTFLAIFKNKTVTEKNDPNAISQFQALTTALAGTIGTGNIVGV
ncbi:MAG: alanine:cation symporter family protein, partial [Oscillospiraceae bacterium]|nr:alanine:cation symporter family protein [Oscillospiraceae bacterium]